MAQPYRTGDVASDAATKGSIAQAILMPIIMAIVGKVMIWLSLTISAVFPEGYQAMVAGAVGAAIIKGWMYLRLRAHYRRETDFDGAPLGAGGRPFQGDDPLEIEPDPSRP